MTTSSKHTPGPWKYGFESIDPNWAIVTDAGGGIVANVNSETGPDATSAPATRIMPADANARLIAAAPELLSGAETLLAALDGRDFNMTGRRVAELRAAIAKAKNS